MKKIGRYLEEYSKDLISWLEDNKVKYEIIGNCESGFHKIFFTIDMDSDIVKSEKFTDFKFDTITVKLDFSRKEIEQAEWLVFRSSYQQVEIINREEVFRYSCYYDNNKKAHHCEQIGKIKIRTELKWNTKSFMSGDDGSFSEMFTHRGVKESAENNHINGVSFINLVDKKGNELDNSFKIEADNILPIEAFNFNNGEKVYECPMCGKRQYCIPLAEQYHIKREYLDDAVDLYTTDYLFGDGMADRLYIMSHKFYSILKNNKYLKGLVVEPIIVE